MSSGYPGLHVTDSTSAGEDEASPGTLGFDILSSGYPGSPAVDSTSACEEEASRGSTVIIITCTGSAGSLELILFLLVYKVHLQVLFQMI